MPLKRYPSNPIITANHVKASIADYQVIGVLNAAVTKFDDQVLLLLRVAERPLNSNIDYILSPVYNSDTNTTVIKRFRKNDPDVDSSDPRLIKTAGTTFLTSISHFRIAKSKDGINFEISDVPAMTPQTQYEQFGIEDARITFIDGKYYITYVAVSEFGIATALASTSDFKDFERHGIIFAPDNRDVVIFPEKIGNSYYALNRPFSSFTQSNNIWIAASKDLLGWGNNRCLIKHRRNCCDDTKIGGSAVPFKTEKGWLEIYHGVDKNNRYCLSAVLLDKEDPGKVLARSKKPFMEPAADYETNGFFPNVIFTCGLLAEDGMLKIYYGAADESICYAEIELEDVLAQLAS